MTTSISNTRVERASEPVAAPVRDQIVLSAAEVDMAWRDAVTTPDHVLTYLSDCAGAGREVSPRVRARYDRAAQIVRELAATTPAEKPEPVVSHSSSTDWFPALHLLPRDDHGLRFYEPQHGRWRFTFVDEPELADPDGEFRPHVIPDHDTELDEDEFSAFCADAARMDKALRNALPEWKHEVAG